MQNFLTIEDTFERSYRCEQLIELSASALPHFYYPNASLEGGRDGVLVEVHPSQGSPWRGTFAFGFSGQPSHLLSMPDPDCLCVVAAGTGYVVSANAPRRWESLRASLITDIRSIRARGLLLFSDHTGLVAYGSRGLAWRTKRLVHDDLKIVAVTDDTIAGRGWDYSKAADTSFVVDLATGAHKGGIQEF
jgi:hypothetical protein